MELVDIYNDKHEKLNYAKERHSLVKDEYRLSCFIWIINDKDEILIEQRTNFTKKFPNMWGTLGGAALTNEDASTAILRELEEELGIKTNKKDIKFIGSHIRTNDFVEVFILNTNIDINSLKLQKEEVQNALWVTIKDFEQMISEGKAIDTSFFIFKNYYTNYYKRYLVFENGIPVYKKEN